ncbi:SERPINE1 mRNA-binding protein 1-like isoform X2 [Saccostrea echinata]|uniref:SERPINE1 mRNA-binding protein 1-like isoform X2 n=1 Tax=Saccostrea echinata TaxID=191078 RepID=UPI002A7EA985|nr:SERPINE1 mRNA-binding protein 1-like isoform X2 [Saccostrea echinata]
MDSQYGIAVTNKFDLFGDDVSDPLEFLKEQEELKKKQELTKEKDKGKQGKDKKAKKQNASQSDNKSTEQSVQKKEDKPNAQSRPPRSARQNREPREMKDDNDSRPPRRREENSQNEFRERTEGSGGNFNRPESGRFGNRGRGRGRGEGRGARGGRGRGGFDRGPKRDFERHSGSDKTGVKPTEKRDGSGSHNWGSFKDDLQEEIKEAETEQKEWNPSEDAENQDPNESTESTEQPVEEGPKQMTLDEWKAQQEKNRLKNQFNIRKPGEGDTSTSQWKKGTAYRKKLEEENEESDEEEEYEEDEEAVRQKNLVNKFKFVFNTETRRGGRGRGPRERRGGGRGGGGRGGRGGRGSRESAPKFDDENDFPSLVKTEA